MGVFVVAVQYKYNSYYKFRMVDSFTGNIRELRAEDVFRYMSNPLQRFNVEHMSIDYAKDTFKFTGMDISRVAVLDANGQVKTNADGMVITGVDGDYVYMANYKGQIIRVHMLQAGGAVKKRTAKLVNADILPNGRIVIRQQ